MTPDELRSARTKHGLSVAKAAKQIGVSPRFIVYRESGERPIPQWLVSAAKDLRKERKK